ncbi:DHA2 family efflux MFS transporter permease subunit [Paenibacillus artemisiicola]|nr:DHA2 family efflux MFS transporter permease subunit [Paenibacillus artemisiicola]
MAQTKPTPQQSYRIIAIMGSLLLSAFIGMFNETALNVALSDLIALFHITASTAQWLTTGYLLTLGILVPISGLLLQWFSTRQLFVCALVLLLLGTLAAALAPGFAMLMAARVIQAAGVALLLPLMFNTVLVLIPAEKRGGAYGIIGLVLVVAPAIGPTVSGLLIDRLNWNWIFWLSLPFLLISLASGLRFMENVSAITKPKIDAVSLAISTLGFGGIVLAFSSAGDSGFGAPQVIAAMAVGLLALSLFIARQWRMKQPIMDLRAFKHPMFAVGTFMIFITLVVMLSAMLVLPMYLIQGRGLSTFSAGLALLPGGLVNAVMLPIMGRVFDKFGPRGVVPSGAVLILAVLASLSGITASTPLALIIALHGLLMIGISMVWMPAQANGLNELPPELYPHGSAIMNTLQQIAGAIGTAVAISIMTAGMNGFMKDAADRADPANGPLALIAGIQQAFLFAMIVAIAGLVVAFFIKRVPVDKQQG